MDLVAGTAVEQCRVCKQEAVYIAVLHDGARVPYCAEHLPTWDDGKDLTYEVFLAALRKAIEN